VQNDRAEQKPWQKRQPSQRRSDHRALWIVRGRSNQRTDAGIGNNSGGRRRSHFGKHLARRSGSPRRRFPASFVEEEKNEHGEIASFNEFHSIEETTINGWPNPTSPSPQ
jgi:hypothetical protein